MSSMRQFDKPIVNTAWILKDPSKEDTIEYRDIIFKTSDLIDMRFLIHKKIEQVLDRASLWTNIMPQKIFNDLV